MFRTWHKALADIKAFNCKFCRLTLTITRLPAQKPACKDLGRNGQNPAITPKAAYTPVSDRAGSRSL
ncbi:ATP-dependent nuclease subunit B [Lacticaseibacillus rhamnosus]|nr:Malolactic regulator [Lacticaseibacillus rhamnosus LOCK900]MCT3154381.1 ATP-dependent nuclease subunit B [Lacticaseibacillus rhamnosus]MCT3161963.1 ATP-dependent nuclease subunit B [Lacticaseibacillus rhamnosus]MCT3163295.1 ATP-dependent nuclease subunit B [Lacticaseibacillus rhamnosus]MCT3168747.1 ATP-dependent nuclease subunit B [Lacticaseibacillus rhamnosus]